MSVDPTATLVSATVKSGAVSFSRPSVITLSVVLLSGLAILF